ncbi:hypothetical protein BKA62DRAFT_440575 [Auriculariales sp. MPI-PUGE-AT-0066]|nr:hypothetical protein BKA62DRAFT_440575 [Auriculariales sp. MPI-PUGE-AT-0066]
MSVSDTSRVTFQDTDAVVSYAPIIEDPLTGWHTVYEQTTASIGPGGALEGVGTSFHETRVEGATLSFQFYGTSLTLFGAANGSMYTVELDNQPVAPNERDSVLATFDQLISGTHNVKLTVTRPNPTFRFYNATFDSTSPSDLTKVSAYNSDTSLWGFNREWKPQVNHYPSGLNQSVMVTRTVNATAWLTFRGSAVWLYGVRVSDHGAYQIVLDDKTTDFNGKSNYTIPSSLLFFQGGLDTRTSHTLTLRNAADAYLDFEVAYYTTSTEASSSEQSSSPVPMTALSTDGRMETATPQPTDEGNGATNDNPSPNVGAIVGGVLGGIISLLLLIVVYLYFSNRRSLRRVEPTLWMDRYPFALDAALSSRNSTPEPSFRDGSILQPSRALYFPHSESLPPPSPTQSFTTDIQFPPELQHTRQLVVEATRNPPPPAWRRPLPSHLGSSARDSYSTWHPDRAD